MEASVFTLALVVSVIGVIFIQAAFCVMLLDRINELETMIYHHLPDIETWSAWIKGERNP